MGLPEAQRAPLKPRLIDLIDRLNKLVGALETQQTALSEDIRDLSLHRRAVSAYGRGASTPTPGGPGKKR